MFTRHDEESEEQVQINHNARPEEVLQEPLVNSLESENDTDLALLKNK